MAYVENLTFRFISNLSVATINPILPSWIKSCNDIPLLTYLLASGLDIKLDKKQKILEAEDCIQRGELLIYYLKEEIEIIKLRKKIYDRAQENIMQKQKDYILKELIKINKSNDKNRFVHKIKKQNTIIKNKITRKVKKSFKRIVTR